MHKFDINLHCAVSCRKMKLYPTEKGTALGSNGRYMSLYLALADPASLSPTSKICASVTLRILDKKESKHYSRKGKFWSQDSTAWWIISANEGIWRVFTHLLSQPSPAANFWFSSSTHEHGWTRFILLSLLTSTYRESYSVWVEGRYRNYELYQVRCYVEAEVTILGVLDELPWGCVMLGTERIAVFLWGLRTSYTLCLLKSCFH